MKFKPFNFIIYYFTRYYYANVDETRRKIKDLIKEDEWNTDKFPEMKQLLSNKLGIQHKSMQELLLDIFQVKSDNTQIKYNNIQYERNF